MAEKVVIEDKEGEKESDDEYKVVACGCEFVRDFLTKLKGRHQTRTDDVISGMTKELGEWLRVFLKEEEAVKPKVKSKVREERGRSRSSDSPRRSGSSSSSGESGDETGSVTRNKSQRKKVKQELKIEKERESDASPDESIGSQIMRRQMKGLKNDTFELLLGRLDSRAVLELERYDEDGEMDLEEYIQGFEQHFKTYYRGDKQLWLGELEKLLTGRAKEELKILRKGERSYEKVKRGLIEWYNGGKKDRREKAKQEFQMAGVDTGETMVAFCRRLARLFRKAYPGKDIQGSRVILMKYLNSVPENIRQVIENQIVAKKMGGDRITFKEAENCTQIFEESRKGIKVEQEKIIKINIGQTETNKFVRPSYGANIDKGWENENWNEHRMEFKTERNNWGRNDRGKFDGHSWRGRNQRGKGWSRPPPQVDYCNFCRKFGHAEDRCRRRLGQCYVCGGRNHVAKDCFRGQNRDDLEGGRTRSWSGDVRVGRQRMQRREFNRDSNNHSWEGGRKRDWQGRGGNGRDTPLNGNPPV